MLHLNFRSTLGTSMKKFENSASFDVAPHVISISNMCASNADETCRDSPPRKTASRRVHLRFWRTGLVVSLGRVDSGKDPGGGGLIGIGVEKDFLKGVGRGLTVFEETSFVIAVSHGGQCEVTKAVENDDDGEPHFPRIDVVFVEIAVEPSDGEVIGSRHDPGCANGIVCTDIRHDGDFGGEPDVGKQELAEKRRERSFPDPHAHRVEQEFVASIRVFFPSGQFVIHRQGNSLLETFARPSRQADDEAVALQAKRHVKIFRHVRFRPEFLVPVLVHV